MVRNTNILLIACLLCTVYCFAQTPTWNADTIMHRVRQVELSDSTREARLVMTTQGATILEGTNEGTLAWKKDRTNVSYYDSSNALTLQIICVKDTLWIYDAKLNRMDIQINPEKKSGLNKDGLFFIGTQGFSQPRLSGVSGDTVAMITLYPTGKETPYYQIRIRVDLRTYRETGFWVYNKDQSLVTWLLDYTKVNETISDEVFRFDPKNYPKGLEILDHREELER